MSEIHYAPVADGLLLDVIGCVCLMGGISQGAPLLMMGVTLTIVQLAIKKINQYTPSQCGRVQKWLTSPSAKNVKVLGACFSLIICEISILSSVIIALVVGTIAAFALPVESAKRRKQIPKVIRRTQCAPPPAGVF